MTTISVIGRVGMKRKDKKHFGKRRKCWLTSIFSFSNTVFKSLPPKVVKITNFVVMVLP